MRCAIGASWWCLAAAHLPSSSGRWILNIRSVTTLLTGWPCSPWTSTAHLIASRLGRSVLVRTASEIAAAIPDNVPVLEPSCWLREADPLPHSWSVTGDSIAAWVARAIGARRLVLIKAPHAAGDLLVDDHFIDAISNDVTHAIVTADRLDLLASALRNDVDAQ